MRRALILTQLVCSLFTLSVLFTACNTNKTSKSTSELVSNENVMFWIGCAANGALANKMGGCYAAGPLSGISKYNCSGIKEFYQLAPTQAFIADCQKRGFVFAIWVDVEIGSTPGVKQETLEKWMALTKETLEYMKTSALFSNATLDASVVAMDYYADYLNKELADYNRTGAEIVTAKANTIKNEIVEKFKQASDPEQAELADQRYNINKINPIIDDYEKQANQQTGLYLSVVKAYDAYKKKGSPIAQGFRQGALDASATEDYDQLAKIKMDAVNTGKAENREIADLLLEISDLRKSMMAIQADYTQKIAPYKDWMTSKSYKTPDLLTVAITSLDNMTGYLLARKKFTNESVSKLVTGIESRTKALILSKADSATRSTILKEAQLKRTTDFVTTINAKIADMWKAPLRSKKLNLSYLYPKYEKFATVLAYETMCQTVLTPKPPTSWMATGCTLMQVEFSKIKNYLKDGLPLEVQMGVNAMRAAGVDAVTLSQIEQFLAQGKPAEAARWHDAAVMLTEVRNDEERL